MVKALGELEQHIVEHVGRYRVTVSSILAHAKIVPDLRSAAVVLEELGDSGWLAKAELCTTSGKPTHYFHLGQKGAQLLGHDPEMAKPLKRDARIECLAIASFCCSGNAPRVLFTKSEFMETFKALWFPGQPVRYYLEKGQKGAMRLAFLKVDRDGDGRWDRLIDTCARFLRQRIDPRGVAPAHAPKVKTFAALVQKQQFQFTVLTALPEKKRAIDLELERRRATNEPAPPIETHVVPCLREFLGAALHS